MSGGGLISQIANQANQAGGGRDSSMPAYGSKTTSLSPNRYNPTYTPMQQTSQQSPIQQDPKQAVQNMGLEALYQSMASQIAPISQQFNSLDQFYQQPAQRQMPTYNNPALNYRPDMSGITANLSRVVPSVSSQQKQSAIDAANAPAPVPAPAPEAADGYG